MNSRISRSTPYLPRYQSLSPSRSHSRRFPSPRGTSQPSERIVYINNAPSRVINSYHVHHSPSPSRTYTIHLCSNKTKNQLTRVTRSLSACDINSSHVYTSHEEIFDRSLKESALRQVGSSEDIYHAVPFFPDVTPSESGVSFGDWEEGSTFGGEDDSVSQHSFGSSSAFCEITVDSELDKCDSDNFSGPDYTGDRALGILHEQFADTKYALKKRKSRRSSDGLENGDYRVTGHVSETTPRKRELVSSQSLDFNKFRTHAEALSVLIPESEVSGKINGKLGKAGNRGSVSTPLAHSTPHVSPGGPGESKLSIMTSWDADAIEGANNDIDPKTVKPSGTLSGQGNHTSYSSRFEDSSCNSSCSEDNYSDVSNVTTSSPVNRKIKLVKKASDKPSSSKKSLEPHAFQQSNTAQARTKGGEGGDKKQTNSAPEDVKPNRQDRPLHILKATEMPQDQQQLSANTSEQGKRTDKHTAGGEWWASYSISTTAGEKPKVIHGEEDTEKSLAFRRDLKATTKQVAGSMPLITPGKHGQEKLRKLSQISPPRVSSPTESSPVSPNDIPSFRESEGHLAQHLISHQTEEARHVSEFVTSENIQNHQQSDSEGQDDDQQLVSVNFHQNLFKTSSDATEYRSSILSEVEIPTNGEISELELYSGALSHVEEYTHDSQHQIALDSQRTVVHEIQQIVVCDSHQTVSDYSELTLLNVSQHKVVPDSQQEVLQESQQKLVDVSQQEVLQESQQKLVDVSQQEVLQESQQKLVDVSQQILLEDNQQNLVSDSKKKTFQYSQQKSVDDSQQNVEDESQQKVLDDSRQTRMPPSEQIVLNDSQDKVENEPQQKVVDDSQQTVMRGSQQTVVDDSQQTPVREIGHKVVDGSQQKLVSETGQKVVEDSQQTLVSETGQKVVENSQQTLVSETGQKVVENSQQTLVSETGQKEVDDSQQTLVSETGQKEVDDSQQTLVSETGQKVVDDSHQKVVHESQQKENQNAKALSHSTENEEKISESIEEIEVIKTESYNLSPQTVTVSREAADRTADIQFSRGTSTVYGNILAKTDCTDGTCMLTLVLHEDVQQQTTDRSPVQETKEIAQEGSGGITYVSEQEERIEHLRNISYLDSATPDTLVDVISEVDTVDIHEDVILLEDCAIGKERTNILEYKVVDNTLSLNRESVTDRELCNEETSSSHDTLLDNVYALDTNDSDRCGDVNDNVLKNIAPDTAATVVVVESTVSETVPANENISGMTFSNNVLVEDGSVTVVIEEITVVQDRHFSDGNPAVSAANTNTKVGKENVGKPQAGSMDSTNMENTGCRESPQVVLHDGSSELIVDIVKHSDPDLVLCPETIGLPGNPPPSSCSDDESQDVNTNVAYKSATDSKIRNSLEQQLIEVGNNRTTASLSDYIESTYGYSSKAIFSESSVKLSDVVKSDEKKFSSFTEVVPNLADKQEIVFTRSLLEKTVTVIPTDTKEFNTTNELLTTNAEILAPPVTESFSAADKETFPTTDKEISHRTVKEIFHTTDSKISSTTDNGVCSAASKELFTATYQELFATKDKDPFTTQEACTTPGKETLFVTDKRELHTTGKGCTTVTPEEFLSYISEEHISIDTSVDTSLLESLPVTSSNSAAEIFHQLSQPATVEQVTTPVSSLSTSGLSIETASTVFPSSLSSPCVLAETSLTAENFLAPDSELETVISTESGLDFAYDVSLPATSISQLQAGETLDSIAQTLEATMHPNDPLEKLQAQLSLFSGDTGLNINVDRNPRQEAADNFQNIVRASAGNFTDFSKDQYESFGDESFLDHTHDGVSLREGLDHSTKISIDNADGLHAVGRYVDSEYDNVTTSSEPVEPQLFTRPHHLHLLQFANTKTSNLWALQEETESATNTPSPKQSRATFVTEDNNLHSLYSVQIIQNNSTEKNAQDDQIRRLLNGQKQIVSESVIVEANKENESALSRAGSNSGRFKSESEDTHTQSAVTTVGMENASMLAADEPNKSENSFSNIAHRQTPEITSGVFRAQLVNISSPDELDCGVNSNVDREKNRVSYLGTFTPDLGLVTNRIPGDITLDPMSSLDALSTSLKQFDRTDIDRENTKPFLLPAESPSAPDTGNYNISSVRTFDIVDERNSSEEASKVSSYLPTRTLDHPDVSTKITQLPTETNSESVYTCTGTAEIKKTSLIDSPVLTPRTNLTPVFTKSVMNRKLTSAKIKQFERILYEFNKGLCTSQDISDFLFFCENYADYTNSSTSPEELYKYFTNDDSEKVQNHTCITLEDEDMNTFRFKRYLKKSHAKRNNGRKILRFLSRLSCVSESQSSFQNSPFDISSGRVKNADKDAHIFSMDSMANSKMRISNPVLISSTSFQLHNILNASPVRQKDNGTTSFDSPRNSADSAYSSLSDPSSGSLSSPAFRHTPGPSESVSSVFSLDITTGDWTVPDNVFSNTSDATTRTSFAKTAMNQSGGQEKNTMFSLSDEFHHFNFSENEIDAALLNKLRYGHLKAKLN